MCSGPCVVLDAAGGTADQGSRRLSPPSFLLPTLPSPQPHPCFFGPLCNSRQPSVPALQKPNAKDSKKWVVVTYGLPLSKRHSLALKQNPLTHVCTFCQQGAKVTIIPREIAPRSNTSDPTNLSLLPHRPLKSEPATPPRKQATETSRNSRPTRPTASSTCARSASRASTPPSG